MKYIDRFKTMDDFLNSELKQLTGDRIATIDGFNLPILKKKMKTVVTVDPSTNEEVETEELQDVWSVPIGEVEKKVDHDYKMIFSDSQSKIDYAVMYGQSQGLWSTFDELKEYIRPFYKNEVSALASHVFETETSYSQIKIPVLSTDNGFIRDVSTYAHDSESWRYVNLNRNYTQFNEIVWYLGKTYPYFTLYIDWNSLETGQETTLQTIGGNSLIYSDGKREDFSISMKIKKMATGTINSDVTWTFKYVNMDNGQEYDSEYDASTNTVSIYDESADFMNLAVYTVASRAIDGIITHYNNKGEEGNTTSQFFLEKPLTRGSNSFKNSSDSAVSASLESTLHNLTSNDYIISNTEIYDTLQCHDSMIGYKMWNRTFNIPTIKLVKGNKPLRQSMFIAGDTPQGDFGATWYDSSVYGHPCCNLSNEDLGLSFYYSDLKVINETSTDNGSTWVPDASAVLVDGNDVTVTYISSAVEGSGMIESLYPTTSLFAPDGSVGGSVVFNSIQGTADTAITYNVGLSYNDMSFSDVFTIIWGDPSNPSGGGNDPSTGDSSVGDSSVFGENDMTITPCTIDDNYSGALYTMNSTVPTEFTVTIPEYTGMPASWMDVTVSFDTDIRKADSMMPDMMMNDFNATVSTAYTSDGVVVALSNLSSASHYQYNITFTYNDTTYCARLDFTTGGTPAPMTRKMFIASSTPTDDYEMTWSQEYMTPCCNLSNSNLNVSFNFSDLKVITETSTDNGMTWDTSSTDLLDGDDVNVIYITAAPAGTTGEDVTLTPTVTDVASDGTTGGSKSFSGITGTADSAITYYIALGYDSASTMYEFTIIWGNPS